MGAKSPLGYSHTTPPLVARSSADSGSAIQLGIGSNTFSAANIEHDPIVPNDVFSNVTAVTKNKKITVEFGLSNLENESCNPIGERSKVEHGNNI